MKKFAFMITLTFTLISSCLVTPAFAVGEVEKQLLPTSPFYLLIRVKESVQQLLTFNQTSKAKLLENFAEQRIKEINYASSVDDGKALGASLNRYQTQKTQVLEYMKGVSDTNVMEQIKERTIEQQQTMTQMQLEAKNSESIKQHIVEVQKEVAIEMKKTVEVVQGTKAATEVDNKTHYVWLDPNADASGNLPPLPDEIKEWEYAPGTEGRDESGRVVEVSFAPGTKAGGEVGNKVEIQWAPGTEGSGENVIEDEPYVIVEKDTETGTNEIKKIEIQQVSGTDGGEGKQKP